MAKKTAAAPKGKKKSVSPSEDDRTEQRVPIQLLVDYRSNGSYLFDFCQNLGTGGVFIETERPLTQGSEVELTFTIPDSKETVHAKGHVIWVQKPVIGRHDLTPGMGVQFSDCSPSQRKLLEDFVTRYNREKGTEHRAS
jgi:type IV pilus assembly protein PilZ